MINDDCISRKMAVEAIEEIVSSMSVCLSVDECRGMKRMQARAIEEVKSLPPIQYNAWNRMADDSQNKAQLAIENYNIGYVEGYEQGKECGYDKGYNVGYNEGLNEGYEMAKRIEGTEGNG